MIIKLKLVALITILDKVII